MVVERLSNWALGGSYVVAIAFYVALLSSFSFETFHIHGDMVVFAGLTARVLINTMSTLILLFIGSFGFIKGLHGLESLEKIAVNLKLTVVAGPLSATLTELRETAIIQIISTTAIGMGVILSMAAIFSQFGAAVADTIGASGLLEEESQRRLNERQAYVPIILLAIVLSIDHRRYGRAALFGIPDVALLFVIFFAVSAH